MRGQGQFRDHLKKRGLKTHRRESGQQKGKRKERKYKNWNLAGPKGLEEQGTIKKEKKE